MSPRDYFNVTIFHDMNRNTIATLLIAILVPMATNAINLKKFKKERAPMTNYNQWVASENLPDNIDGEKQFYPSTTVSAEADTIAVVRGTVALNGMSARKVFLATLVYAIDNLDAENKEGIEKIDFDDNTFSVLLKSKQGKNDSETTYTRLMTIKAKDGGFDFETTEIDCRYREKGLIPRTLRLEKLHPENNNRHSEIVKEFTNINSHYITQIDKYASTRTDINSPNFDKVKKGEKVSVGMNGDEVTILIGAPLDKRKSGDRIRWIYSNDYVIIFTDGKVSKIIE